MVQLTDGQKLKQIQELYDELPKLVDCKGLCWRDCADPPITIIEHDDVLYTYGIDIKDPPRLVLKPGGVTPTKTKCPALTEDHRCGVYDKRPFICRAYGAIQQLPCAMGCEPVGGLMDAVAAAKLTARVDILGGTAGVAKAQNIKALADLNTTRGQQNYLTYANQATRAHLAWWARYLAKNRDDLDLTGIPWGGETGEAADVLRILAGKADKGLLVKDVGNGVATVTADDGSQLQLPTLFVGGVLSDEKGTPDMFVLLLPPHKIAEMQAHLAELAAKYGAGPQPKEIES